jgi:PAS domain S-box-containing protein
MRDKGDYVGLLSSYDIKLVILSILVVSVSSFATFKIISRMENGKGKLKLSLAGSFIMALGIWSMHFIGMLSNQIHMNATYDSNLTIFSFLYIFIGSFTLFHLLQKEKPHLILVFLGVSIFGVTLVGMHLLGMLSIEMDVEIHYNLFHYILSILVAFCISIVFLKFAYQVKGNQNTPLWKKLTFSIITGLGISCMHFISMADVTIEGNVPFQKTNELTDYLFIPISTNLLAYALGLATIVIILTVISLTYMDKFRAERLQRISEIHYQSLVEHNPFLVFIVDNQGIITNVNPKGLELIKLQKDQVISRELFSFFKEEEKQEAEDKFFHLKDHGCNDFEAYICDGKDKWIPMWITFVPIMVDGKMHGQFVIAKDNTDVVVYKEQLEKAQQDLTNTMKRQQGFTIKFMKVGERYIHTLCEGELIYKLGLSPEIVMGNDVRDFLPSEYTDLKLQAFAKAWNGEMVNYDENLNGIDYYLSLSPVIQDGKVIEVIGVAVDISERKRAEQALVRSEKWYKNIFNELSDGIFLYSADDTRVILNDNIYEKLDIYEGDWKKQTIHNYDIPFIEEDGSPLQKENNPIYHTLKTGSTIKGRVIGIKGTDKTIWLSVSTKLVEPFEQKEVPQALVTVSDITFQKQQELKLRESHALRRTLIDSLPIGMIVVDSHLNIVALNRPFCDLFSIEKPIKSLVGENAEMHRDSFYKCKIEEIIAGKKEHVDEIGFTDNRILKRTYFPYFMDQEFKWHLLTFEDITESKRMEREILGAKEEAEKANLAKSLFLSKMSHELRTPLNGILGFSQLLELDDTLNERQQRFVQEILKGGRHLLNLINEILDLSRIETGKLKISNDVIHLDTVMIECINLIRPAADGKNIQIINNLEPGLERFVYVDQIRLRQILLNLLDNAIKYNREYGKVTISCTVEKNLLFVHIADTGLGIPADEQKRIFEPFYRINHARIDGAGIGLSLVYQLIQLMGGRLGVYSQIGEGSDFWFSLPLVDASKEKEQRLHENIEPDFSGGGNYKILYIEDNPMNFQLIKEILSGEQEVTLLSAMTGKEGLEIAAEQSVDLILLDLNLPDLDGYEVLDGLKLNLKTRNIPVIAVSANAMPDDIHHTLSKGFDEYITKPIDVSSLLKIISEHLITV